MRATRVVPVVTIALAAVLGACAPAPTPTAAPAPPPAAPSVLPAPTTTAVATTVPGAADGTRYGNCADGTCEIEVSGAVRVPIPGATSFTLSTTGQPDEMAFVLRPRGVDLRSGEGPSAGLRTESGPGESKGVVGGRGATIATSRVVVRLIASDGTRAVLTVSPA